MLEKYGLQLDSQFHGSEGPLQNSYPRYLPELRDQYTGTLDTLGIHNNPDPVRDVTDFLCAITQELKTSGRGVKHWFYLHHRCGSP